MIAIAFAAHLLLLGVIVVMGEFSLRPNAPIEAYTVEIVPDGELGGHMPAGLPKVDLGGEPPKRQVAKQAPPPPKPAPPPERPKEPEKAPEPPPPPPPPPAPEPEPVKPPAPEPEPEEPKPAPVVAAKEPDENDLVVATPTAAPTAKPSPKPTAAPTATPRPTAKPTPRPTAQPTAAAPKPSATPAAAPKPSATPAPVKSPQPSAVKSPAQQAPRPTVSPVIVVRPQPTPSAHGRPAEAQRGPQPAPTSAADARIAAALERVQRNVGEQQRGAGAAPQDGGVRAPGADARGAGGVGGTDAPDPNRRVGIGPGRGGAGELRGVEFLLYYNRMLASIREAWVYTGTATNVEVKVRFRILDDGVVSDLRVTQPSGDPGYDASVVRAVRAASPLGAPPDKHRADFADVELTFQPGDLKAAP